MSDHDSARPWKLATAVLGVVCAVLAGVVVLLSAQTIAPAAAAGKVTPPTDAPVSLRKFAGPEALIPAAKESLKGHMDKAGKLTYKSAGVNAITIDTTVVDDTKAKDGSTSIAVSVKLLVTKQPGNSLLAAISATGSLAIPGDTPKDTVEATKVAALNAAAESTFADLLLTLKKPGDGD